MSGPVLKVRDDAYWIVTDAGITALTHRGFSTLAVSGADKWVERLRPHLDGQHTMDEFLGAATGERRAFVERLLRKLIDRGVVSELNRDGASDHPEVSLLGYFRPDADAVFDAWCGTCTAVIGSGRVADATAAACARAGLREVVAVTKNLEADGEQFVHVAPMGDIERVRRVERWCADRSAPLLQVILDGPVAWVAAPGVSFTAARPRMSVEKNEILEATEPAVTILANYLANTLLRCYRADRRLSQLTRFDARDLSFGVHRFVPAVGTEPAVPESEEAFAERFAALMAAKPRSAEEFSRAAVALTDEYVGVFDKVAEADFAQFPLRVAQTTVSLAGRRQTVCGISIDAAQARHAAAIEAIRCYSSRVVDARRLIRGAWVRAFDLVTELPTLLPVGIVFPNGDNAIRYQPATGVAAGRGLGDAIVAGAVDLCRARTIAELDAAASPFPRIDLSEFVAGAEPAQRPEGIHAIVAYCVRMLTATGVRIDVYDVTGSLGVSTFAVVLDGETVAYGCGTDTTGALSDGLLTAAAAWQSRHTGQSDYAPGRVIDLPLRLRGTPVGSPIARRALDRRDLLRALANRGASVVAALLDHDPHTHAVLPVVHVSVIG